MDLAILVVAVFFAGMGLYGLVAPAALARPFRLAVESAEARSEVRAVYGGFGIGVAGLLVFASLGGIVASGIVLTVAVALGGMAMGRVVSRMVDARVGFYPVWFYFLVEVAGATVLLWRFSTFFG